MVREISILVEVIGDIFILCNFLIMKCGFKNLILNITNDKKEFNLGEYAGK